VAGIRPRYVSATSKSTNKKKMAENLHQTYAATFLPSRPSLSFASLFGGSF